MKTWALQDAKAQLSELIETAEKTPQCISKRGRKAVVVLSIKEYQKLMHTNLPLGTFLQNSPLADMEVEFERNPSPVRRVKL